MGFRVGQKVVCVNDDPEAFLAPEWKYTADPLLVEVGKIYTVREVCVTPTDKFLALKLIEVVREDDWPLNQARFRPLVEDKDKTETGMSILYGLLKTKDEKELVG